MPGIFNDNLYGGYDANKYWCCPEGQCTLYQKDIDDGDGYHTQVRNVSCPGNIISLNQTCHSECHLNLKKNTTASSDRSYAKACGDDQCIQESKLCNGQVRCKNSEDLKWCKDSLRSEDDCPASK